MPPVVRVNAIEQITDELCSHHAPRDESASRGA